MKKTTFGKLMLALVITVLTVGMAFASCSSCKGSNSEQANAPEEQSVKPVAPWHDYDGVIQDFTSGTSHIQALHRQTMHQLVQLANPVAPYEWRNSRVILNDTLTAENIDDLHIIAVNDVFYYWDKERGPFVQYISDHVKYGTQIPFPINDVWIEDQDMSDQPIKLSAEDALTRLKEWNATTNGALPKSYFITLRLPVGPKACNPQWTFGDEYNVLFIDAVTGEVRDYDPAFK
jgi:hypothetical protein